MNARERFNWVMRFEKSEEFPLIETMISAIKQCY